jgi:hypothetical protein
MAQHKGQTLILNMYDDLLKNPIGNLPTYTMLLR